MKKPHQLPVWTNNSSYYSAPVGDRTDDLPHSIASTWPRCTTPLTPLSHGGGKSWSLEKQRSKVVTISKAAPGPPAGLSAAHHTSSPAHAAPTQCSRRPSDQSPPSHRKAQTALCPHSRRHPGNTQVAPLVTTAGHVLTSSLVRYPNAKLRSECFYASLIFCDLFL